MFRRLILLYILLVSRWQRVPLCCLGLFGAPLPLQVHAWPRPLKKRPALLSFRQTVSCHDGHKPSINNQQNIFCLAQLKWFVCVRRGTDRGNQAGEGGEKAAGVDEARVAKKGERSVGSEQTPQEPR